MARSWWWKITALVLLFYTYYEGFIGEIPRMPILNETIRNLYFHVTMWMAMLVLMICNAFYGILYLNKSDLYFDLIYAAYFILRNAIPDDSKRARLAAVYGIFAFVMMIVFIMVLPKMTDSLHPGKGGNPGFNKYDLDANMRMVFYPAVIAWTLLGVWMMSLRVRIRKIEWKNFFC